MTFSIQFHPTAEDELVDAAAYYEREREGLGDELLDEVARSLQFASQFPEAAPVVRGNYRSLVISRFPFSVIYRILAPDTLRVLVIANHRRRPSYWHDRS